jgi:c-di-GMP-binding flagellar brake protein YcgR
MSESIVLTDKDVMEVIGEAVSDNASASMSHLTKGKWHTNEVCFCGLTDITLHVRIDPEKSNNPVIIAVDQPVGMSLLQGFAKYIFEVSVVGFEPSVNNGQGGTIVLNRPEMLEKMKRRAYARISVPDLLHVKTLFWHRGYTDGSNEAPLENYWQGDLMDLSAGGLRILIDHQQVKNFRVGQIVGLQFTPMPYEKPIIVEGLVKRFGDGLDEKTRFVGIEFLGLEAAGEGREKLHRIIDTINEYEHAATEGGLEHLTSSHSPSGFA